MPLDESWSWKKFFKGFFSGKNTAKAIVMGVHLAIVIVIIVALVLLFSQIPGCKKTLPHQEQTSIGTNTGSVTQTDNHSTETVSINHYHLPLSDLFNWFGFKSIKEEKKSA